MGRIFVCPSFFARVDADGPFVKNRQALAELAAEGRGNHGEPENHEVEGNRDGGCHEMAALLEQRGCVGDEERVDEVGEVGVAAELVQDGIEPAWVLLVREDREEEDRAGQRVEEARRAQLMGRVDGLERRVARLEDQLVVVGEEPDERGPEEHRDGAPVFLHEALEFLDVHRKIAAEHEDEDVVNDPVVEAVHEEWLEQGVVGQRVDERVERHGEARPVVEAQLRDEEQDQADFARAPHDGNPERHEQVEPDQDHEEVKLVFRRAEEQDAYKVQRVGEADAVEQAIVQQVEGGPDEVRDEDRTEALLHEGPVVERLVDVEVVEEPEGRDEEEDGHAEARGHL